LPASWLGEEGGVARRLISLLTAANSIVAECFERIGVTAAKLTELAVIAEHSGDGGRGGPAKR